MTEQELVRAAQRGNEGAFEELALRYEKQMYRLALRMCGREEDAWEIYQEALLAAWRGLGRFRGESALATWLYRLTSNAAIDYLRRQNRQRGLEAVSLDDEEAFVPTADPAPSPQRSAELSELRDQLQAGLLSLGEEQRQVLLLRELQGLSYEEISRALELDLGTVKSRIARGREKLRRFLLDSGNFSEFLPSNRQKASRELTP